MSFFFNEHFNLPDSYQDGISLVTSGNGLINKVGTTVAEIQTFEDSDKAYIVSTEGLEAEMCRNTPFKVTQRYKIVYLKSGDYVYFARFFLNDTQPVLGDFGLKSLGMFIYNAGGTLREYWRNFGAIKRNFNGTTASWSSTNVWVRTLNLNTWYTITVTYHPESQKMTLNNGVYNVDTDETVTINDNSLWFVSGFHNTNTYGRMKLDYLNVEDLRISKRFSTVNSLTTKGRIMSGFDGSFITAVNDLLYCHRESFTAKNEILDYLPVRESFLAINRIGDTVSDQRSYDVKVFLDNQDISNMVESWNVENSEGAFSKSIGIQLRDKSILKNKSPYKLMDDKFFEPRIKVVIDGVSIGEFFWEEADQLVKHGEFGGDIGGKSVTAMLLRPFLEPMTRAFDEETTKRDLANSLTPTIPVLWNVLNSKIYADTFGVKNKTPGEIIREIVQAGGGSLFTDFEDNIICEYKPFDTNGKSPVVSIMDSEIIESDQKKGLPTGENSIEVFGFDRVSALGRWPVVNLSASKMTLKSNGADSLVLTAYCYNKDGSFNEVETIENEGATPSTPNKISVSKRIKKVIGIWRDVNGSPGDSVAGPFEFDGTTITTNVDMGNYAHLVTYEGGDTCSFSVDKLASVETPEVLIENGVAKTTVRASAGGGGFVNATASFKGQSDFLTITMDDPRVTDIDAVADPTKIARGRSSDITCRVTGEDGVPVKDGMEVSIILEEGKGYVSSDDQKERVSSTHIIVATSTGEIEGEEVTSSTEVNLSVHFPISNLISIYRVINDEEYKFVNYATNAEYKGKSITLDKPLPNKQTIVRVTYTSGGIAKAKYNAAKLPMMTVEELFTVKPFTAFLRCTAGGEDALLSIDVMAPRVKHSTKSSKQYLPWQWEYFPKKAINGKKGIFVATPAEEVFEDQRRLPTRNGYTIEFDNSSVETVEENCNTVSKKVGTITYIVLTVQGEKKEKAEDWRDEKGNIHGRRWVKDKESRDAVEGATVQIDWNNGGGFGPFGADDIDEETTSISNGSFSFVKGKKGKHAIKIYHENYELLKDTIEISSLPNHRKTKNRYDYVPVEYYAKVRWRHVSK